VFYSAQGSKFIDRIVQQVTVSTIGQGNREEPAGREVRLRQDGVTAVRSSMSGAPLISTARSHNRYSPAGEGAY
jgi:hypothetical protein